MVTAVNISSLVAAGEREREREREMEGGRERESRCVIRAYT